MNRKRKQQVVLPTTHQTIPILSTQQTYKSLPETQQQFIKKNHSNFLSTKSSEEKDSTPF